MQHITRLILLLVVLLVLLAGCGIDPSVRIGAWQGSTPYGDFTIHITGNGTEIQDISYSFQCGDNFASDSNLQKGATFPYPLDGRKLDFGVWIAGQIPMVIWKGEFSTDGKTLSGELSLFGGLCISDFEIIH